jgi:hypothetical protein
VNGLDGTLSARLSRFIKKGIQEGKSISYHPFQPFKLFSVVLLLYVLARPAAAAGQLWRRWPKEGRREKARFACLQLIRIMNISWERIFHSSAFIPEKPLTLDSKSAMNTGNY